MFAYENFCRLGCENSVALDIFVGWMWKFCCSGYFCRLGCGNFVALDISAGWIVEILLLWIFLPAGVVEILLLIKSFDRLGDLIYMVL